MTKIDELFWKRKNLSHFLISKVSIEMFLFVCCKVSENSVSCWNLFRGKNKKVSCGKKRRPNYKNKGFDPQKLPKLKIKLVKKQRKIGINHQV